MTTLNVVHEELSRFLVTYTFLDNTDCPMPENTGNIRNMPLPQQNFKKQIGNRTRQNCIISKKQD